MAMVLRVGDNEECGANNKYYDCSDSDFFKYTGCCSHNPCIKPRGCRDDSVTSDLSSWSSSEMSETETTFTISEFPETTGTFTSDISDTETTLLSRRKPSASLTMSDDGETSSPARHTAPSTTMTDSGITHTVSNPRKITVTNRRTVFTSQAPSTPTGFMTSVTSAGTDQFPFPTGSFDGTATSLPTETSTSGASLDDNNNAGSPSIGLVVGAVIGGIAFLALIIAAVVCIRRRKAKQMEFPNTPYYLEEKADKSLLSRMLSRKSTRRSEDPFAPFGGRIDRVDNHVRPPSGTFEMDGADNVVHELPAVTFSDAREKEFHPDHGAAAVSGYSAQTAYPTANGSCIDPRANLNATLEDRQQKQFVNHWNQYRTLGESTNQQQQPG